MTEAPKRGRPRLRSDDEILFAALRAFAAAGYDGMSVRALNAELGLSHEAISQRFGTKQDLYFAAVDRGLSDFSAAMTSARSEYPAGLNELDELRVSVRSMLVAISQTSDLGQLIVNHESRQAGERLDHIVRKAFAPGIGALVELVARLVERGEIWPVTGRTLFFLVQGAGAPFHATKLSAGFDAIDGPLDATSYIDGVVDLIMRGLVRRPTTSNSVAPGRA